MAGPEAHSVSPSIANDPMKGETKPQDKVARRGVGKIDPGTKPNVENHRGDLRQAQHADRHAREVPAGAGWFV
jgi:hypothetical protein